MLYELNILEFNIYDKIVFVFYFCYIILFVVINVFIKISFVGIEFGWVV